MLLPAVQPVVPACTEILNVAVAPGDIVPTLKVRVCPLTLTLANCAVAVAAPLLNATEGVEVKPVPPFVTTTATTAPPEMMAVAVAPVPPPPEMVTFGAVT